MRAVLIGAVESSRIAIEAIARADGWSLPMVLTLPQDKAGRHSDFVDLAPAAARASAELVRVADSNSDEAISAIRAARPDIAFVIGWSQICKEAFRSALGGRVVGYHPAPLPRLRGRAVIPWTILNREPISASSLFWIDDGVDSGAIIGQQFFHVADDETAATLYAKHMAALAQLLDNLLPFLAAGSAPAIAQDERYATWAAKRVPIDGAIDWGASASEIALLIRAVGRPYEGAMTFEADDRLVLWSAFEAHSTRHSALAGQVVEQGNNCFSVMCGDGNLLTVTDWLHPQGRAPRQHARLGATSAKVTAPLQMVRQAPAQEEATHA